MKLELRTIWGAIGAVTAWLALTLQFYVLVGGVPGNGFTVASAIGRFFLFFTILSNILVACAFTIPLLFPAAGAGRFFSGPVVAAGIAVYISIVAVVYNILLRSLWSPEGNQKMADELLHVVVPLLYISYWNLFANKSRLRYSHAFRWLIFPAVYLVYALIRGKLEGFYPYPFIDASRLSSGRIVVNSMGLLAVFILTGLLFVRAAKKLSSVRE